MRKWLAVPVVLLAGLVSVGARAQTLQPQAINEAQWPPKPAANAGISPALIKLQVLLDRAHFSPGEIDGKNGENLKKAVDSYAARNGLRPGMSSELWRSLTEKSGEPVIVEHTLTDDDVRGPYVSDIPAKMEDMKDLPSLSYGSPIEKIAERFHMSPELLRALNGNETFEQAGKTVLVTGVAAGDLPDKVARIEVDKSRQTLTAFNRAGDAIAVYPATVGSREKPAPDGALKVTAVAKNPTYHYDPAYAFKGVTSEKPFTIKPGPNNPVGVVWIGLNRKGYGIHGTPEPAKVSKAESHGCIRLTNWDALQLASATGKNITVDFVGEQRSAATIGSGSARARRAR